MSDVSVRLAATPEDYASARDLCMQWLDWHWRNYPDDWPTGADHPMNPDKQKAVADDLPHLHARPTGGILIGSVKGQDVGCVMYNAAPQSGVAVFNRMFVNEAGRGHGVGGKMLDAMFKQMAEDGYGKVRFSSATFLTHARKMYEAAGFTSIPQPEGIPEVWRDRVYFMERDLASRA